MVGAGLRLSVGGTPSVEDGGEVGCQQVEAVVDFIADALCELADGVEEVAAQQLFAAARAVR